MTGTLIAIGIGVGLMLGAFLDLNVRHRPEADEHAEMNYRDLL